MPGLILPSHSHLCWNTLQGSQSNDAKAKILAATVKEIVAKAKEDSHALPDDLKKVCMPVFVLHIKPTGPLPIETLT